MQTSRRELLDDFLSSVNASGDARARKQANLLYNRVLEEIWMKRGWRQFLDPTPWQFSTITNTREYGLPDMFGRVSSANRTIRNVTKATVILPIDRSDLEKRDPAQGTTNEIPGVPTRYAIVGTTPVQVQPASTGDALEVVSSSAGDVSVRAFVEGLTTGNLIARRQVTLNGTNAVAIGTWARIYKFGKSYPDGTTATTELTTSEGTVTLRKAGAGTTLQVLAPDQSARDHQTLVLYPEPDAVYVIAVPILRAIERSYLDADPIPMFWNNAIVERMQQRWKVSDGDAGALGDMWPALVDLICYDNASLAQERQRREPYRGS